MLRNLPLDPNRHRSGLVGAAAKLGLVLAGTVLAFVLAEVALRVALPQSAGWERGVDEDAKDLPVVETMWGILRPNLRAQVAGAPYFSNRDGMRGPDFAIPKPAGVFRIAVIGDSFTNGSGVRYEQAYPFLVSEGLNAAGDTRRFEVLNFGIPGFNLRASVDRFRKIGLKYDPDLIVYGYTANDIEGPNYRGPALTPARKPPRWNTPSRLLNFLGTQSDYLFDLFWHRPGTYLGTLDDNYFHNPPAWEYWRRSLTDLATIGNNRGICVVMLQHTTLVALHGLHTFRAYNEATAAAAEEEGIPVVDPLPYFFGRRPEDLWVDFWNRHPNPEGHRILARALMDGLARLPAACWKGPVPAALRR